jgi:hypothetical protein
MLVRVSKFRVLKVVLYTKASTWRLNQCLGYMESKDQGTRSRKDDDSETRR